MIDTQLLRYPEQLAARLTQIERDLAKLQRQVDKLERSK